MIEVDERLQRAEECHRNRRWKEAEGLYREILDAIPNHAEALHGLGLILMREGDVEQAELLIQQAIDISPGQLHFYHNLAITLREQKKWKEASETLRQALRMAPDMAPLHRNLGSVLRQSGDFENALVSIQQSIRLDPEGAESYHELGLVFRALGKDSEAIDAYQKCLSLRPDYAHAYYNLGNAYRDSRRFESAADAYRKASALRPDFSEALLNLGTILRDLGEYEEAVDVFERLVSLRTNVPEYYVMLGKALQKVKRLLKAQAAFKRALELMPDYTDALNGLGTVASMTGDLDISLTSFRRLVELEPDSSSFHSDLIMSMLYTPLVTWDEIVDEHREWNKRHAIPLKSSIHSFTQNWDRERPLKVGFVSQDFRHHANAYFILPVFRHTVQKDWKTICYSQVKNSDHYTEQFKQVSDGWYDSSAWSDTRLADQIRHDKIDILFDLNGHTGGNRLLVFAQKPAPVQVRWVGYTATSGLDTMDYFITDAIHTPERDDHYYAETMLRMSGDYVCYAPPDYAPEINASPFSTNGYITFGSFNMLSKISPEVGECWARILQRVENSRLILNTWAFKCPDTTERALSQFEALGISRDRVTFMSGAPHPEFLKAYHHVDIGLDTFPYAGGLTTCEALWMGVPVITMPRNRFCSRHSASHLTYAGLSEFVADSLITYEELAVSLASNKKKLKRLRGELRDKLRQSRLMDVEHYSREFSEMLRAMWRETAERIKPAA